MFRKNYRRKRRVKDSVRDRQAKVFGMSPKQKRLRKKMKRGVSASRRSMSNLPGRSMMTTRQMRQVRR